MEDSGVNYIYIEQEDSDHFLTLKRNRLQFFKETEKFANAVGGGLRDRFHNIFIQKTNFENF